MRQLQNTTGPVSFSETPGEAGSFTDPSAGKAFFQDLIKKANSVPISKVFRHYNLRLDEHNRKTICPFKSHSNGRERTASFWIYPETNTYCCYGCRNGSCVVDFVSIMDGISKAKAAYKILDIFGDDADENNIIDKEDFSEKLEIMMDFSNVVRDFRQSHTDEKSFVFIEHVCSVYDQLNLKHKNLTNEALRKIVADCKEEISSYKL